MSEVISKASALTTNELHALMAELVEVAQPDGVFVETDLSTTAPEVLVSIASLTQPEALEAIAQVVQILQRRYQPIVSEYWIFHIGKDNQVIPI